MSDTEMPVERIGRLARGLEYDAKGRPRFEGTFKMGNPVYGTVYELDGSTRPLKADGQKPLREILKDYDAPTPEGYVPPYPAAEQEEW